MDRRSAFFGDEIALRASRLLCLSAHDLTQGLPGHCRGYETCLGRWLILKDAHVPMKATSGTCSASVILQAMNVMYAFSEHDCCMLDRAH